MPIQIEVLGNLRRNYPGLNRLDLSGQDLTDNDIYLLLQALQSNRTLTQLDLTGNKIGNECVKVLAANKYLTQLYLNGCEIDNEGAKALAKNRTLIQLNLGRNDISDAGAKALAENDTLTQLNLSENPIGAEGAKALAGNKFLTQLNLSYNPIGDEGAKALAGNTNLMLLDLAKSGIGEKGARFLARNTTLISLNLNANEIGDEGAKAFIENITLTDFLYINTISDPLKKQLDAHLEANRVRYKLMLQREFGQESALTESSEANLPSSEKLLVDESQVSPLASLSLSVGNREEKATEPEVGVASPSISFFKPLYDEEQSEKVRIYALAVELQNALTERLPILVTINRGKYLEIQEQEEEALDDLSKEALKLTLARLFGYNLYEAATGYRIGWPFLSPGQSEQFASLYEAEYQCLLEASATKTFSEAETLKTASFVDALDNDPSNKAKIAAALQTLIGEKLVVEIGMKQGISFSIRGLSEVLSKEQSKAQALRETLKILTEGSPAKFSEDSILLPWDSLRAKYVRELNATFQTQLMRIERSASRSFSH